MFKNNLYHTRPLFNSTPDVKKQTYFSVLLQRLHQAGSKRPQWVVAQSDEHIYSFPVLRGPLNGNGAVSALTLELQHKGTT